MAFFPTLIVVSCSSYSGSRCPRQSIMKIDNLSELDTTARVHTILASVPNYISTAVLRNMTIQCIQHDVTQRRALQNTLVLHNRTSHSSLLRLQNTVSERVIQRKSKYLLFEPFWRVSLTSGLLGSRMTPFCLGPSCLACFRHM